jgi:hypothetical protein
VVLFTYRDSQDNPQGPPGAINKRFRDSHKPAQIDPNKDVIENPLKVGGLFDKKQKVDTNLVIPPKKDDDSEPDEGHQDLSMDLGQGRPLGPAQGQGHPADVVHMDIEEKKHAIQAPAPFKVDPNAPGEFFL